MRAAAPAEALPKLGSPPAAEAPPMLVIPTCQCRVPTPNLALTPRGSRGRPPDADLVPPTLTLPIWPRGSRWSFPAPTVRTAMGIATEAGFTRGVASNTTVSRAEPRPRDLQLRWLL